MKKKWVFFDLDGTLSNSAPGIFKSARYAAEKMGAKPLDDETLKKFLGPPLIWSFIHLYDLSEADAQRATEIYRKKYDKARLEDDLFPGVREMLLHLKESGLGLCVVTLKASYVAQSVLEQYEITPLFAHLFGGEADAAHSEKADLVRKALRETGASPGECIMVGDRKFDILGARECGVESVGCYFGYTEPGELEEAGATHIVHSVAELESLLLSYTS